MLVSHRPGSSLRGAVGLAISLAAIADSHCRRSRCFRTAFVPHLSWSRPDSLLVSRLGTLPCKNNRFLAALEEPHQGSESTLSPRVTGDKREDKVIVSSSSVDILTTDLFQQQDEQREVAGFTSGALVGQARRDAIFSEEGEYRVNRDILEGKKTRYVSRVMYDGTNYNGFQLQRNGQPTIQGVLETTLSRRFQTYVPVVAAGRTDTGVHAMGQAIHFDLPKDDVDLGQLTYVMNQMMPEDVRVWNISHAPPASPAQQEQGLPWHVMLNARGKVYSYRLFVGDVPSPLDRSYRVHASKAAKAPIKVDSLYETIPHFVGRHDFAGFSNQLEKRAAMKAADGAGHFNTWRELYHAEVVDEGGGNIRLDFYLDGALYRMVRNMVGTMLAVAAGRVGVEVVEEIFQKGWRDASKVHSAPPHGLTLEIVKYGDY